MKLKPLLAGGISFVVVSCACGGGNDDDSSAGTGSPMTGVSGLQPDPDGEGGSLSSSAEECLDTECPSVPLFGAMAPGCCQGDGTCGGRIRLGPSTSVCVSPNANTSAMALVSVLSDDEGDVFVPDASCPSRTVDGTTLRGCCDETGRCGVSSEPWTAAATRLGLRVPLSCLDAEEVELLTSVPAESAGPARACGDDRD